jgi:hypothetical protein
VIEAVNRLRAYAAASVKECWRVLGTEKQIEVHRQPQGGQYAEFTCTSLLRIRRERDRLHTAEVRGSSPLSPTTIFSTTCVAQRFGKRMVQ